MSQTKINPYNPGIFLIDIGKHNSPRWESGKRGVPSGTILFAVLISSKNEINIRNKNRLIKMIRMEKSICHKRVNKSLDTPGPILNTAFAVRFILTQFLNR